MGQAPFQFTTNLQGARAYLTSEGDIPTAAYKAICTGWEYPVETKAKDAYMLVLDVTVQDGVLAPIPENAGVVIGELKGRTKRIYIIIPETCKNPNNVIHAQGNLKGWLLAFGCPADAVNSGQINIDQSIFAGREVLFWNVQNTSEVNGNVSALTPDMYNKIAAGTMQGPTKGKARKKGDGEGGQEEGASALMPSGAQSTNPMAALGGAGAQAMTTPMTPTTPASNPLVPSSLTPAPNGGGNPLLAGGGAGTGMTNVLGHQPRQ